MIVNSQLTGRGKLGKVVYSASGGECIAKAYPEKFTNPKTEGQVTQRSKFKLMSQLAASVADSIAIKKEGLKSGRNIFISINNENARMTDGVASINLNKVQLTKSNRGIGDFEANRQGGGNIAVNLLDSHEGLINRVVYVAYTKELDGSLNLLDSKVVDEAGVDGTFDGSLKYTDKAIVIYAYAIKDTNEKATVAYGNMQAPSAEQVAKLLTTSSDVANGSQVTKTKGLTMLVGEDTGSSDSEEHFLVSVTHSGNGSVSGGGRFVAGQTCTLTATPDAEASFVAWKRGSASGEVLSTSATYTFEVQDDIVVCGVFQGGPTPRYQIVASVTPEGYGTVSGTGEKEEGSTCSLVATPAAGKTFVAWKENGQVVSTSASYVFRVERARTLVAEFADRPSSSFENVKYGSSDWNQNLQNVTPGQSISGTNAAEKGHLVATYCGATAPAVGSVITPVFSMRIDASTGAFTLSSGVSSGEKYWLVAGTLADDDIRVNEVYPYSVEAMSI